MTRGYLRPEEGEHVDVVVDAYLDEKGIPGDLELDAAYQLETGIIRSLLGLLEESLRAEGIEGDTALRVVRRLLYGAAGPDAGTARWRMRKQERALAEAMLRPPDPAVIAELLGTLPPR